MMLASDRIFLRFLEEVAVNRLRLIVDLSDQPNQPARISRLVTILRFSSSRSINDDEHASAREMRPRGNADAVFRVRICKKKHAKEREKVAIAVGPVGTIRIKRIYEKAREEDGIRILIDRLWPRGISKEAARVDEWMKEIAPSDKLRKWFAHDPKKWAQFRERHRKELQGKKDLIERLRDTSKSWTLTLVYSAKDELHNQAVVLEEFLDGLET